MSKPRAAPAYFPYREHRTMAQVMAAEAAASENYERRFREITHRNMIIGSARLAVAIRKERGL